MVNIKINGQEFEVENNLTVMQACEKYAGSQIPRFCYHDKLKIAGNCRMCLVEIKPGPPKPAASCATPVANNMEIFTDSEMVKKARGDVMELILMNHPLDCPVCDQGGECDLQDQAYIYGKDKGNFCHDKRAVVDKYMGPLVKTKMNRCIHCTRCVRFINDVAGFTEIGSIGRGVETEITTLENALSSELSGNIIDLCPVGALTAKPYEAKARPWELTKTRSIDVFDAMGSNIVVQTRSNEVLRVLPDLNDDINEEWISDKSRFAIDGLANQRVDTCFIARNKVIQPASLEDAILNTDKIIKSSSNIAMITGKMTDMETIYLHKILAEKINCKYYSCIENGGDFDTSSRGNYIFNTGFKGIDKADFILIVGCNTRKDAPVLNARIRKASILGAKVVIADENRDLKLNASFLEPNISSLTDILNNKSSVSKALKDAKFPMIILGSDIVTKDEKLHSLTLEIAEKFFIKDDWNGYCFLHKNIANVGGLDLDFNTKSATKIMEMAKAGEIDCLILNSTSDIDTSLVHNNCKIISFATNGDDSLRRSSVIFPSLTYVEKSAFYTNSEGRIQKTTKACEIIDNRFDECQILCKIIANIDSNFSAKTRSDVQMKMLESLENKEINVQKSRAILAKKCDKIDENISIASTVYNFYMTDSISRNSRNMANCVREILLIKK
ncbi:NADH-quinone oxidoreductase subunit NuoG [Candidatus Deianiraea vastatrix]|uniref:NADH-quinone oxidoreductase n=1 Tax=Candidatus Deianiraea vastatrix TaxID=2163644 RepID=A0A5B8XF78_9RICK|nr:NADH-quinone oxidoreductase subunit NuoG [Candidatus Deianiraea vastatrix]QED23575.1 NADH-quinone oxidoreductase chain 3 [Candidatus Deianiraea vastatrix]